MVDIAEMLNDLAAESAEVDAMVAELPASGWATLTPAAGWTVAHQVGHLAWTDGAAHLAMTDPEAFTEHLNRALSELDGFVDRGAEEYLDDPAAMLERWRAGRAQVLNDLAEVPPGVKIAWYGTSMAAPSLATARLMETWAHGQDIADALGVVRTPTARLRHIAHLGHRTLGYAFMANGKAAPAEPVRVELTAPDGTLWTFGPEDAANRVDGPALDFCRLVTQRVHRSDTALTARGPVADAWLDLAQAFAGTPGTGREPVGGSRP
jgi:uncharacterized protein (TIGR03084 family)